jgi:hypothetical protein
MSDRRLCRRQTAALSASGGHHRLRHTQERIRPACLVALSSSVRDHHCADSMLAENRQSRYIHRRPWGSAMLIRPARRASRFRLGAGLFVGLADAALLAGASARPAHGDTAGSGPACDANFDAELDADCEQGSAIGQPSPWTRIGDGGDSSLHADGNGPCGGTPSNRRPGRKPRHLSIPTRMRRLPAGWTGDSPTRRCVIVLPERASGGCAASHRTGWHDEAARLSTIDSARRG